MTYQDKFDQLFAKLQANPAELEAFLRDPLPVLHTAGIPVMSAIPPAANLGSARQLADVGVAAAPSYKLDASVEWWGVDFVMNEDLTQAVATGAIVGPPLVALITSSLAVAGIVTGPIAAAIAAAFGTAFAAKIVEIKLVDGGSGVHWPVTWPQWAGLVAAVPAGPAAILGALLLFIHPLRN